MGKPQAEKNANAVLMTKRLHRANPISGQRRSPRKITAELTAAGFVGAGQAMSLAVDPADDCLVSGPSRRRWP